MSSPKSNDKPTAGEGSGARVYDTDASAVTKQSGARVYDAPSRAGGLPMGVIVGIVVVLLILAFLLFQFVF